MAAVAAAADLGPAQTRACRPRGLRAPAPVVRMFVEDMRPRVGTPACRGYRVGPCLCRVSCTHPAVETPSAVRHALYAGQQFVRSAA